MENIKRKKSTSAEFVKWFSPLLNSLKDLGGSGRPKEITEYIANKMKIPDTQLEETTKTGIPRFYNQVAWARQYLVWEGLLDNSKKGIWTLTPKGFETILDDEKSHDIFLKWVRIHLKTRKKSDDKDIIKEQEQSEPEEVEHSLTPTLLEILQSVTHKGFEIICKRLLREHGFENVFVTGASHDGGIDGYGTLELNPFISMKVLFQCKRYKGTVSRAQVGDFRNAMIGRAEKGLMITTGIFSEDAKREASREGAPPIELIDGKKLVELFETAELGVKPKTIYEIDLTFFEQYIEKK